MGKTELICPGPEIRLDVFISENCGREYSRSFYKRLITTGMVMVNGRTASKAGTVIAKGDVVEITFPEPENSDNIPQDIPLDIVYEDTDLLVINKPQGMVVHPAAGHHEGTLVNALLAHCGGELSDINGVIRPGIVHRIDKDTSGLLVVAKTPDAKTSLGKQFFDKTTKRAYQALVWGVPDPAEGTIESQITRNPKDRLQMAVSFDPEVGKHAVTHYTVLERFGYTSLVECRLETGRTHQIRVHMKHIGHPLFSDERYGGDQILKGTTYSKYRQFVQNCFETCPRQALHAKTLGFVHPLTGKEMFFNSELPQDMAALIEKWRAYVSSRDFEK